MDRKIKSWTHKAVLFITVGATSLAFLAIALGLINGVAVETNNLSPDTVIYWLLVALVAMTALLLGIFCFIRWQRLLVGRHRH